MVVRGERVPDAVLVVVVLAMGDVLRVAHRQLFATVPERTRKHLDGARTMQNRTRAFRSSAGGSSTTAGSFTGKKIRRYRENAITASDVRDAENNTTEM